MQGELCFSPVQHTHGALSLAILRCVGVLAWPPPPCVVERGTVGRLLSIGVVLFPMRQRGRDVFAHSVLLAVASDGHVTARPLVRRLFALLLLSKTIVCRVGTSLHSGPTVRFLTCCANPSYRNAGRTADAQVGDAKIFTHEKQSLPCQPAILHTKTTAQHHHAGTGCHTVDLTRAEEQPDALIELELELLHLHAILGNLANLHIITGVDVALPS